MINAIEDLKPLEKHFSQLQIPFQAQGTQGTIEHAGFVTHPCPHPEVIKEAQEIIERFPVKGNVCSGLSFVGQLKGEAALVHILQEADGKVVGGLSILVLNETDRLTEKGSR